MRPTFLGLNMSLHKYEFWKSLSVLYTKLFNTINNTLNPLTPDGYMINEVDSTKISQDFKKILRKKHINISINNLYNISKQNYVKLQ